MALAVDGLAAVTAAGGEMPRGCASARRAGGAARTARFGLSLAAFAEGASGETTLSTTRANGSPPMQPSAINACASSASRADEMRKSICTDTCNATVERKLSLSGDRRSVGALQQACRTFSKRRINRARSASAALHAVATPARLLRCDSSSCCSLPHDPTAAGMVCAHA